MSNATPSPLARPSSVEQAGRDLVIRSADGQRGCQIRDYFYEPGEDDQAAKLAGLNFPVTVQRHPVVDGELWALGTAGGDVMIGGDFDLNVAAGDGDDVILAGDGDDYLCGDAGSDWLDGGAGDDRLYGATGNDRLHGGSGNDLLVGSEGNDLLMGGTGHDLLKGGTGGDIYLFRRGDGQDRVLNETGNDGEDVMQFGGAIATDQLWFRQIGNDLQVSVMGTDDCVTFLRWYAGDTHRVDRFELAGADGAAGNVRTLGKGNVDALVAAMSAFSPPAAGCTSLPDDYRSSLQPVLAANWN